MIALVLKDAGEWKTENQSERNGQFKKFYSKLCNLLQLQEIEWIKNILLYTKIISTKIIIKFLLKDQNKKSTLSY